MKQINNMIHLTWINADFSWSVCIEMNISPPPPSISGKTTRAKLFSVAEGRVNIARSDSSKTLVGAGNSQSRT